MYLNYFFIANSGFLARIEEGEAENAYARARGNRRGLQLREVEEGPIAPEIDPRFNFKEL